MSRGARNSAENGCAMGTASGSQGSQRGRERETVGARGRFRAHQGRKVVRGLREGLTEEERYT